MAKPNLNSIAKDPARLFYRPEQITETTKVRGILTNGHWLLMSSPRPPDGASTEQLDRFADWDERWMALRNTCCAAVLCPPEWGFRVLFDDKGITERTFGPEVELPDFSKVIPTWPQFEYLEADNEDARCAIRSRGIESVGFKVGGKFVAFAAAYALPMLAAGLKLHVNGRLDPGVLTIDDAMIGLVMPVRESPQGEIFDETPETAHSQTTMEA